MSEIIFGMGSKMWSIYVDEDHLNEYVETITEEFKERYVDVNDRYDISKGFVLTNPISGDKIKMYCITLICTGNQMDILMARLNLINIK